MKAILVFIDGTICHGWERQFLEGTADFYKREFILRDQPVSGSAECLKTLSQRYKIVYIGARPEFAQKNTLDWLEVNGFPKGDVYLSETQEGRLALVKEIKEDYDFIAGIGDRWDDNELHAEIGCLSIILKEHEGKWDKVADRIESYHRKVRTDINKIHLQGKVEGLARVCPLLQSKYGEQMWDAFFDAVLQMAEKSREERQVEELASFAQNNLDPTNLRDAAKWDDLLRAEDWENNPVYGLQEFELVEASKSRYVHKVTRCAYAELWKRHDRPDIGYQIHCRTDMAWWDRPAWNADVRFEQPRTIMQGDDCCLFIQYLPEK